MDIFNKEITVCKLKVNSQILEMKYLEGYKFQVTPEDLQNSMKNITLISAYHAKYLVETLMKHNGWLYFHITFKNLFEPPSFGKIFLSNMM